MIEVAVNLQLSRSHHEFQACVAFIRGNLNECCAHLARLHSKEAELLETFKYDKRRTSYLLGRLSAKQAIGNLKAFNNPESIWIDSGIFQFPVVRCSNIQNIQVSICHCDDIGISIAFPEEHPMAIDVERISIDRLEAVSAQVSHKEKLLLNKISIDNIIGYTAVWSIKESLSKIIRTGLMTDFKLFELNFIDSGNDTLTGTFSHFAQYKALAHINNGYVISIVLPGKSVVDISDVWQMFDLINSNEGFKPA